MHLQPFAEAVASGGATPAASWLVINGDDFGCAPEINEAILRAHRLGVLTSASLMVTGEAAEQAVRFARDTPSLAVGLHLVLVEGRAALPPGKIPQLVDRHGRFPRSPVATGLRYWFDRKARQQLRRELEAQFARFAATGLPLAHVDGHLNMHLHPAVFPTVLALAERFGASRVRIPRDHLLWALHHDPRRAGAKLIAASAFAIVGRWCRWKLRGHNLAATERTYGLIESGAMREAYVLDVLERIVEPSAEIYFHPTTGPRLDPLGPNPEELETLLSPCVRDVLRRRRIRLTGRVAPQPRPPA
jgi:hopanoid biosynthesis associated protein HpnK